MKYTIVIETNNPPVPQPMDNLEHPWYLVATASIKEFQSKVVILADQTEDLLYVGPGTTSVNDYRHEYDVHDEEDVLSGILHTVVAILKEEHKCTQS